MNIFFLRFRRTSQRVAYLGWHVHLGWNLKIEQRIIRKYLLITILFNGTVQQRIHNTLSYTVNEEKKQGSIWQEKKNFRTPHVDWYCTADSCCRFAARRSVVHETKISYTKNKCCWQNFLPVNFNQPEPFPRHRTFD